MRIDAHQYFSDRYLPKHLWPILERNRFEASITVSSLHSADETRWLLRLASEHEFIRGVAGWADLNHPRLGEILDEYQRHPKFRAIRYAFDDELPDGLKELARRGLPLDVAHLRSVSRIAERCPSLRLVIDDFGVPFNDDWARRIEQAAQLPQVCCKLTSLTSVLPLPWKADALRPYVQHVLAVFGPRRLMFGSGWPACLPAATWKEALAAFTQSIGPLPMVVREQLLGGAAAQFYGIA